MFCQSAPVCEANSTDAGAQTLAKMLLLFPTIIFRHLELKAQPKVRLNGTRNGFRFFFLLTLKK